LVAAAGNRSHLRCHELRGLEVALKRDTLRLSPHQSIETSRDWNGRYFIAYSGGASVFIRDIAELRRFLKTWGPEAHADEEDPTASCKMIT
jgi:hypothetical protein